MSKYCGWHADEFIETKKIGTRARSTKKCVVCKGPIVQGNPHDVHYFYEYACYPTHKDCSEEFLRTLNEDDHE